MQPNLSLQPIVKITVVNHKPATLYNPGTLYQPGQVLKGVVVFKCATQQRIASANISFIGICLTEHGEGKGRKHNKHSEVINLCDMKKPLFLSPFDVTPQVFEWPFEFTIPNTYSYTRKDRPGYIANGVAPLPASFRWHGSTFSSDTEASIKYGLIVKIESGGLFDKHREELPIIIHHPPTAQRPDRCLIKNQLLPLPQWSSRALRPVEHTFMEKMKHALNHEPHMRIPTICFRAFVHIPRKVAVQEGLPIGFSIKRHEMSSTDPLNPNLVLDRLELSLRAYLDVKFETSGLFRKGEAQGKQQVACQTLNFKSQKLPLDGEVIYHRPDKALTDWAYNFSTGSLTDFDTHTIKCRHKLKVKALVRHTDTNHYFEPKAEFSIEVVDAQISEEAIPRLMDTVEQTNRILEDTDPELPAYSDDISPPIITA